MLSYSDILLSVDFDRTLTAPDASVPERNLQAIREFMALGGSFTVNTGRSVPMFRREMTRIPVNAPFLLYNGSGAYDPNTGELTLTRPINLDLWETLEKIHSFCPELHLEIQAVDGHYSYGFDAEWNRFYEGLNCPHGQATRDAGLEPFLKLSMFGKIREQGVPQLFHAEPWERARFDEVEAWLRENFSDSMDIVRSGARIIDMQAFGATKAASARALQQRLGKKILVCVGDAENDISMLDGADYAYCPADGVLADRYENVCKCADGAVADVIYEKIPEILRKHS